MDRGIGLMEAAATLVYKQTGDAALRAHIFYPEGFRETDERTAVVFFSAGMWDNVLISQFAPHCLHFRERGAVAVIFEYRELSKYQLTPIEAIADGRSALRWLRLNHADLGIHPERIVAAGASGGAHLCLCAAMLKDTFDEPGDPAEISCRPNAMALFSPVVDTTRRKGTSSHLFREPKLGDVTSPSKNIAKGLPPTIIFHGSQDRQVPAASVIRFAKVMKRKKNRCELHVFPQEGHSFFNFNFNMRHFEATLNEMDRFLVELEILPVNELDDGVNRLAR